MQPTLTVTSPIAKPVSPFWKIWFHPKKTLRTILNFDPGYYVIPLAMVIGISQAFERASSRNWGDDLSLGAVILICLIAGPLGGLISVYIGGAFLGWVGRWLGGTGESSDVRSALAWSSVPSVFNLVLVAVLILGLGREVFMSDTTRLASNLELSLLVLGVTMFQFIFGLWQVVLVVACLAEAHTFSNWKSLATLGIAFVIIMIPVGCIVAGTNMLSITP